MIPSAAPASVSSPSNWGAAGARLSPSSGEECVSTHSHWDGVPGFLASPAVRAGGHRWPSPALRVPRCRVSPCTQSKAGCGSLPADASLRMGRGTFAVSDTVGMAAATPISP